jgi:glyoxylase-like metal-dependent hydrolase (beta-lactamase superfamily II)/rhodanese-related sulfurtransferase
MEVLQLYTNCLSEAAYFIESNGEAAVVDPLRDVETYLQLAKEKNATIKYIFETHFHADFVSGHLDLQKATGATIIYGPGAHTNFNVHNAQNGEVLTIGNVTIKVLHTPGHTLESTCYLLKDEQQKDYCIFTGDTLFIGDVGRPDLAQKGNDITMEDLAGTLYDSLQKEIMPLGDDVIIYPAHGAGSSCGKNLSKETSSTIGEQKKHNYALQPQTKEAFVKAVTEGLAAPPQYFPINASINKKGYATLESIIHKGMVALDVLDFKQKIKREDVLILDTRHATIFTQGFIPNSIFIGLEGRFAEWAGSMLPFTKEIILVTEDGKEKETIIRLARVGLDNIGGYLKGGFAAWSKAGEPIDLIIDIEADELVMDLLHDENAIVVDVRKETEFGDGHIKTAKNLPLSEMIDPGSMAFIEDLDNLYIHCAGGYRSVIAASILKKEGIHNLRNVLGGWASIKEFKDKIKIVKEASVLN